MDIIYYTSAKVSSFSDKASTALCWYDYQDFSVYMQKLEYDPKTQSIQARKRYKEGKVLFQQFLELGFTLADIRELVLMENDVFVY